MKYLLINIFMIYFLTNSVYSSESVTTCSRKAEYNNKEILIDGYTGIKGSGLNKLLMANPTALKHLENYQNSSKVELFNLISGSVSTASLALGLVYNGDKTNKNNFLLIGGIFALVNFLTTKTVQFYNERELTLAIEEFNKTSDKPLRLLQQNKLKQGNDILYINKNWSF